MVEAERCHRLAILDSAALVADGVPAETAARLDGHALRLQCQWQRQALLADMPGVLSVAQVGCALRLRMRAAYRHADGGAVDCTGVAVDALRAVDSQGMWRGADLVDLWREVAVLAVFTGVMMTLAVRRFRKRLD